MNKSILISIRPEHVVKILNGEKTLELRKSVPKDFVGWVYIYVTKSKPHLIRTENYGWQHETQYDFQVTNNSKKYELFEKFNGKIVARFWFNAFDRYYFNHYQGNYREVPKNREIPSQATIPLSYLCLTLDEVNKYGKEKDLFVWNIREVQVFDKPKELKDFHYYKTKTVYSGMDCPPYVDEVKQTLRKAPQSWQYVWEKE